MRELPVKTCKNCLLYDKANQLCKVNVVYLQEEFNLQTKPDDKCIWIDLDDEINKSLKSLLSSADGNRDLIEKSINTPIEVKQVRSWSDGKNGYIQH